MLKSLFKKFKNWKPIHLCWFFRKKGWKVPKYLIGNPATDVFTGGTASASLETEAASGAFDDVWDDSHRWYANSAAPEWLKYDLGVGVTKTVIRYRFQSYLGDGNGHPTAWTFQGSNNDSDWDTLDTQSGISWSPASEIKTFAFSNTTAYRYYKWNFTAFSGGDFIIITEMEGFDTTDYTIAVTVGSFILTGIAVDLLRPIINMAVTVGEFALTGVNVILGRGYTMAVSIGQFILTGIDIIFSGWRGKTKHTTDWTGETKHTASWTGQSKSETSPDWEYQDKH